MKKILEIKNIGSYYNFNWSDSLQEKEFWKLNLFYGDNGSGKSTLTRIFKNLNKWTLTDWATVDENIEKHWKHQSEVQSIIFEPENAYDKLKNNVLIFDKDFINRNVVDSFDNHFNPLSSESRKIRWNNIVFLWWFDQKELEIDQLLTKKELLKRKLEKITQKQSKLQSKLILKGSAEHISFNWNMPYSEISSLYEEMIKNPNLEKYIEGIEAKVDILNKHITDTKKKNENISTINSYLSELNTRAQGLVNVDFDCAKSIAEAFKLSLSDISFSHWEEQEIIALTKIINDKNLSHCLLCNQSIKTSEWEYIESIQKYISFSVSDNEKKINLWLSQLNEFMGIFMRNIKAFNTFVEWLPSIISKLGALWFTEYNTISLSKFWTIKYEEIEKYFQYLIQNKQQNKSSSIEIDYKGLNQLLDEYKQKNSTIKDIFTTEKIKTEETIKDEETLIKYKKELFIFQNSEEIKVINSHIRLEMLQSEKIKDIETTIKDKRGNLKSEFKEFADEYSWKIKENLHKISSSLHFKDDLNIVIPTEYTRWASRAWFQVKIGEKEVTSTLSDGEKRSIALAYFMAQVDIKTSLISELETIKTSIIEKLQTASEKGKLIEKLKEIKSKIEQTKVDYLVMDDPAVDYDGWHKQWISEIVVALKDNFEQTFIFSHDYLFFTYLSKNTDNHNFYIEKFAWNSVIRKYQCTKDTFSKFTINLEEFSHWETKTSDYTRSDIITAWYQLRYCLEYVINNKFFWLSDWTRKTIDNKFQSWNLEYYKKWFEKKDELIDILNYCNQNGSHYWDIWYFVEGPSAIKFQIQKFLEIYKYIFEESED